MTDFCADGDHLPEKLTGNNTGGKELNVLSDMTMQQGEINGPTNEITLQPTTKDIKEEPINVVQDVPRPQPQPQPQPNQVRPPLQRIDSRGNFPGLRPGFPIRPQQIRPQSQPFPQQRPPPPPLLNRPPGQQQGQPYPQQLQQGQPRGNFRPLTPFPRQPGPRPPGIFQQRSVPAFGQQRPLFTEETQDLQRSRTLDSSDLIGHEKQSEEVKVKANVAKMNNRSFSLQSNSSDHQDVPDDARRRSVSSVESFGEKEEVPPSRPDSRMSKMNKILEDDDDKLSIVSNRSPSSLTDISQKSVDNDTYSKSPSSNHKSESLEEKPPQQLPQQSQPQPQQQPQQHQQQSQAQKQESRPLSRAETSSKEVPTASSPNKSEGDNDSGVDESTQGNEPSSNGETRASARKSTNKSRTSSATPTKARSLSRGSKSPASLLSPDSNATTPGIEKKKVPMNKIQVGSAPSPNLKVVKSKIGSLANTSHKPGGGKVKIESKKLDFKKVTPRIEAKNDKYEPKGGDKKIQSAKLQWNVKSKIGSLDNATYKPKGGDKKIESVKLDFKEKAKPKVGSTANLKHVPGGGDVKIEDDIIIDLDAKPKPIETKKIELNVTSKIGSLDNMKHKPGGGDKKIFDDKEYLKQKANSSSLTQSLSGSQTTRDTVTSNEVLVLSPTENTKRYLLTIREEKTLSRSGSIRRQKSAPTPRPAWRF